MFSKLRGSQSGCRVLLRRVTRDEFEGKELLTSCRDLWTMVKSLDFSPNTTHIIWFIFQEDSFGYWLENGLEDVQKWVNIVGLSAVFWKSGLQDWSLAGVWKLGFWEGSHHPVDKIGSLCLNCLYKQCAVCWTPAFLWGIWDLGTC